MHTLRGLNGAPILLRILMQIKEIQRKHHHTIDFRGCKDHHDLLNVRLGRLHIYLSSSLL